MAKWLGWQAPDTRAFGHDLNEAVIVVVRDAMAEARGPMSLPTLAQIVHQRTGYSIRESSWGGTGSWDKLLEVAGGLVRQDGPSGGYVVRREWTAPLADDRQ